MIDANKPNKKKYKVFIITISIVIVFFTLPSLLTAISNIIFPPSIVPEGMSVYDYCAQFHDYRDCPLDICEMGCSGGGSGSEGCAIGCGAKPCYVFGVRKCPDWCQIEVQGDGVKVCNPKS